MCKRRTFTRKCIDPVIFDSGVIVQMALCVNIDPLSIGTLQRAPSMTHGKIFDGLQGQSSCAVAAA